jgi:hypothetical protein
MKRAKTKNLTHYLSRILIGTSMIIDNQFRLYKVNQLNLCRAPYDY